MSRWRGDQFWSGDLIPPTKIVYVDQDNVGATLGAPIDSSVLYFIDGVVDVKALSIDDLVDSDGSHTYEVERINWDSCSSMGTLDSYRQGLETGTGRFGGTPDLTLRGAWTGGYRASTTIVRDLTDGAYSLFQAGAGFSMASRFLTDINCDLPATAALLDFAPANFANPSTLQIHGAIVSRVGIFDASDPTLTPNISHADLEAQWKSNVGLGNTFEGGRLTASAEAVTPVAASGTFYGLLATWTADNLEHFDSPASGQLRHLGTSPREYRLTLNLVLESTANHQLAVRVRKWDASAAVFIDSDSRIRQVNALSGPRDVAIFNYAFPVILDQNDYIIIQVANTSGTANITAEQDSDWFLEER